MGRLHGGAPDSRGPGADPLRRLGLESVWQLSRGEDQRIAVIDTGVARHVRLAHLQAAGDYVSAGDGTQDCDGHGTVVAGIIAAAADPDDPTHFAGVAPAATLLAIRQSTTKFGPPTTRTGAGSATWTPWRAPCAPPPIWARR